MIDGIEKLISLYNIPEEVDDLRHEQMNAWWRSKKATCPVVKADFYAQFLAIQAKLIELGEV
jgi:hypothetical protein